MENFTLILIETCPFVWQILMFLVTGIVIEFCVEWGKAVVRQKSGKSCPAWLGTVFGIVGTCLYLLMAYMAFAEFGSDGWYIPGEKIFIGIWGILFFVYQYKATSVAKAIFKFLCPRIYDPNYTKPVKEKKSSDTTEDRMAKIEQMLAEIKAKD